MDSSKKLTLLYLANDVIQNAKKKGPEFKAEFAKFLPRALQHVSSDKNNSICRSVERIISVWEERKVFDPDAIVRFKSMLGMERGENEEERDDIFCVGFQCLGL